MDTNWTNKFSEDLIRSKYNNENKILYVLEDDRVVVGEEVDDENRLWYIIKNEHEFAIEPAINCIVKNKTFNPVVKIINRKFKIDA